MRRPMSAALRYCRLPCYGLIKNRLTLCGQVLPPQSRCALCEALHRTRICHGSFVTTVEAASICRPGGHIKMRFALFAMLSTMISTAEAFRALSWSGPSTSKFRFSKASHGEMYMKASFDRRDSINLFLFSYVGFITNRELPAFAQKPPPRPKVTSIPQECLQSGGCGMVGMDENFPKFKAADQVPEILDPKSGLYSSGLKIQEIAVGDEKGPCVDKRC